MFTLAIYHKKLTRSAAVYVAEEHNWKLVKNFDASKAVQEAGSVCGLQVGQGHPNIDMTPAEFKEMFITLPIGILQLLGVLIEEHKELNDLVQALPTGAEQMYSNHRCTAPYVDTGKQTIQITHAGIDFFWDDAQGRWEFKNGSVLPDGTAKVINGTSSSKSISTDVSKMVAEYIASFPMAGAKYLAALCAMGV